MNAAFSDVFESFGYSAVHQRLGREGNLSTLDPGFQEVAYIEANLFADILRNDYLVLALDGDECYDSLQPRSSLQC